MVSNRSPWKPDPARRAAYPDTGNTHSGRSAATLTSGVELDPSVPLPPASHPGPAAPVGRKAAGGAVWVFLAFAVGRALGFATSLILARLLVPEDFGLVSFAMVLIGGLNVLQDLGVRSAIIYTERDVRTVAGTALTLNVASAALLFGVSVLLSPWLAALGNADAIGPIVVTLAFGLVISSFDSIQRALLVKDLAFRRKFLPDLAPLFVSGILSIVLAFLGFGVWSLVYGYLAKAVATTLLFWYVSEIRPRPAFQWPIARELFQYGKHVSLASIVGFIGINADYFIVGHTLGTFALGLYTLAFTISNLPCIAVGQAISTVMFPAYSRVRGDTGQLVRLFEDAFSLVCALAIPAGIGIFVCGPAWVSVLFGEKWSGIERPLQLLAIYGGVRTIAMGFAPFYNAIGRPGIDWRINVARLFVLVPLMAFSVRYGLIGIPVSYLIVASIFVPLNAVVLTRTVGLPLRWLLRLTAPQVVGTLLAMLVITISSALPVVRAAAADAAGSLLVAILAIVAYAATVVSMNPRIVTLARMGTFAALPRRRPWATT